MQGRSSVRSFLVMDWATRAQSSDSEINVSCKADHELDKRAYDDCNLDPKLWTRAQGRNNLRLCGLVMVRKTTSSTNERTAIASCIQRLGMTDRAPILRFSNPEMEALMVGTLNSFVLDYCARNSIGGTDLSLFIIKQLPVPKPSDFLKKFDSECSYKDFMIPRILELIYTGYDLREFAKSIGYNGPPFAWNNARRFLIRCELDAAFFRLYELQDEEVDYVMETFPIIKRKDKNQWGEFRTKNTILKMYREMEGAIETDTVYRTWLSPPPINL